MGWEVICYMRTLSHLAVSRKHTNADIQDTGNVSNLDYILRGELVLWYQYDFSLTSVSKTKLLLFQKLRNITVAQLPSTFSVKDSLA